MLYLLLVFSSNMMFTNFLFCLIGISIMLITIVFCGTAYVVLSLYVSNAQLAFVLQKPILPLKVRVLRAAFILLTPSILLSLILMRRKRSLGFPMITQLLYLTRPS